MQKILSFKFINLFLFFKLLNRDPNKRLGFKKDAEEIREHAWLKDINWEDCYNRLEIYI